MRVVGAQRSEIGWIVWNLGVAALLPLAAADFYFRTAGREVAAAELPAFLLLGIAYLVAVMLAGKLETPLPFRSLLRVGTSVIVAFGGAFALLLLLTDSAVSRAVYVLAGLAGFVLLEVSVSIRKRGLIVAFVPVALAAVLVFVRISHVEPINTLPKRKSVMTELLPVTMAFTHVAAPSRGGGGSLVRWNDGLLLATGDGAFYKLRITAQDSVLADSLPIASPMNTAEFRVDFAGRKIPRLRITGMIIDTTVSPAVIYVAHQFWNHADKCFTMRVSRHSMGSTPSSHGGASSSTWSTVFESQPCLPPSLDDIESGGRLARDSTGRIFLTLGDFGFIKTGDPVGPQSLKSDYGKVILLNSAGGGTVFTSGHRNPEGLLIDHAGRIWEAEHGPQGGDEINLIVKGSNYGWPLDTYGTDYGKFKWPYQADSVAVRGFTKPEYAFVPSQGTSNLIEVGPKLFGAWSGDLLLGSMRTKRIFRLRLNRNHIVYAEPIVVGLRVRDLAQEADGRIALWTDAGVVVVLSPGRNVDLLESKCMSCHTTTNVVFPAVAPGLHGVIGRRVGSEPGFDYSAALRQLGGTWTVSRIDSFIRDPAGYAPGNNMHMGGVPDSAERRAIITALQSLR